MVNWLWKGRVLFSFTLCKIEEDSQDLCEQNLVILGKDNVVALSIDGVVLDLNVLLQEKCKVTEIWKTEISHFLVSTLIIRPLDHFQLHTTHQQRCQSWDLITIWK